MTCGCRELTDEYPGAQALPVVQRRKTASLKGSVFLAVSSSLLPLAASSTQCRTLDEPQRLLVEWQGVAPNRVSS